MKRSKSNAIILLWLAIPIVLIGSQYFKPDAALSMIVQDEPGNIDVPMVEIPGGTFLMGLTIDQAWQLNRQWKNLPGFSQTDSFTKEIPQLEVQLPRFHIDKFEVTNAQYRQCLLAEVCVELDDVWDTLPEGYASSAVYDDYPVRGAGWEDADAYCRWVDKRLPTEAEWEKAARGTDGRLYPWGNEWRRGVLNPPHLMPAAIGSFADDTSPYGVRDLAGSAPEWTADSFYPYPGNPRSPFHVNITQANASVIRGFGLSQSLAISAVRLTILSDIQAYPIGFRCAQGTLPLALSNATELVDEPILAGSVDLSRMVYVKAGAFIMGSVAQTNTDSRTSEAAAQRIYLDGYYIDRHEVTVSDYVAFLNALGSHTWRCDGHNCAWTRSDGLFAQPGLSLQDGQYQALEGMENRPITYIWWSSANSYCQWAGKRLPSEAEWEKAARGTDGRLYPWGNDWDASFVSGGEGIVTGQFPALIGSFPNDASPFGAYDMLGNAEEWVSPLYDLDDVDRLRPRYIHKGLGRWAGEEGLAARDSGRNPYIGFRCAYTPPDVSN